MKLPSCNHYLWLALPVFLVIAAEMLIFAGHMEAVMIVHALNVVLLISIALYIDNKIFAILMLLPLFRLLNAAMPVFFNLTLYSYPLVYAPMFLPMFLIMKEGILSRSEAGRAAQEVSSAPPSAASSSRVSSGCMTLRAL